MLHDTAAFLGAKVGQEAAHELSSSLLCALGVAMLDAVAGKDLLQDREDVVALDPVLARDGLSKAVCWRTRLSETCRLRGVGRVS